jgi:hypothetical protein
MKYIKHYENLNEDQYFTIVNIKSRLNDLLLFSYFNLYGNTKDNRLESLKKIMRFKKDNLIENTLFNHITITDDIIIFALKEIYKIYDTDKKVRYNWILSQMKDSYGNKSDILIAEKSLLLLIYILEN